MKKINLVKGIIEASLVVEVNGVKESWGDDYYEVLDIVTTEKGVTYYVCNEWYKEGVRQLVPDVCVINYWEISNE